MDTAVNHLHHRATLLLQQITMAMQAQSSQGVDMSGFIAAYQSKLQEVYADDLPLAMLRDTSDIIFHAEGPAVRHHAAGSGAVSWLCAEAEKRIRQLGISAIKTNGAAATTAGQDLRVLLNGLAPGSLYLGFSVDSAQRMAESQMPLNEYVGQTETPLDAIRQAVCTLPMVYDFVGDEAVNRDIFDAIADPQVRDASLMAAYHLSPTGRRGIHTIEISAPRTRCKAAPFTARERTVLRESAMRAPLMQHVRAGVFVGELREIDLDAKRFHLRNVPGVGGIRCVLGDLNADIARRLIGHGVKVSGEYEADASGRPRLMRVQSVEPYQVQQSMPLDSRL